MSLNKKCIIYSAFGRKYIEEAFNAARITKKITQNTIDLVLHTNVKVDNDGSFDEIIVIEKLEIFDEKRFAYRIQGLIDVCQKLNFDQFLFLDTDAFIKKPEALEVFSLLDHFDIAVSHAPVRDAAYEKDVLVPECFPEFNCGVILFNKKSIPVFKEWLELYLSGIIKHPHDQGAFRRVLYFSKLRIATLTPEYNHREKKGSGMIIHNRAQLKSII